MYILRCSNGSYYTGSTTDLEARLEQHQLGLGANFTRKHLPIKLVYYEKFERIDDAFYREKQIQGWSRKKKEALIKGRKDLLPELSRSHASTSSATALSTSSLTGSSEKKTTLRQAQRPHFQKKLQQLKHCLSRLLSLSKQPKRIQSLKLIQLLSLSKQPKQSKQ